MQFRPHSRIASDQKVWTGRTAPGSALVSFRDRVVFFENRKRVAEVVIMIRTQTLAKGAKEIVYCYNLHL